MLTLTIENDALRWGDVRILQQLVRDAMQYAFEIDRQLDYVERQIPKVLGGRWQAYRGGHHVAIHCNEIGTVRLALVEARNGRPA